MNIDIHRIISIMITAFLFGMAMAILRKFGLIPDIDTIHIIVLAILVCAIVEVFYRGTKKNK